MNGDAGLSMVTVPAGLVTLADRRTRRSWEVDVASFLLAATPVTRGLHSAATGQAADPAGAAPLPMVNMSWLEAVRFCNALSRRDGLTPAYEIGEPHEQDFAVSWERAADGYRLPTEAEWEHACRAGTTGPRYGPLDEIAWYRDNSGERLHPVADRRPNPWGLYDMLGNSWDWCWDLYDEAVYGRYRVLRGGGWFDEHWSCRAGVRRRSHPTFRTDDVGLRLARTPSRVDHGDTHGKSDTGRHVRP